jgi:transcriptional regulator with XRE-family HTH domain
MLRVDDLRGAFGRRIRRLRHALAWSQEQLAERADTHWTYISGIERGRHNPGLNMIGRLARALDVSPSKLLRGVGSGRHRGK